METLEYGYGKSIDCTEYENCPKQVSIDVDKRNKLAFSFIFLGCWGVYCKQGEHDVYKYKEKDGKKKWEQDKAEYGARDTVELMKKYTVETQTELDAIILAGDNVYSDIPDDEMKLRIEQGISTLYNMPKQLSVGFEKCMKEVPAGEFLVGIGNHDIETCDVLNMQMNYAGWTMDGLSYNRIYHLANFSLNLIFIDTNMYEKSWCKGVYPDNAIEQQEVWLRSVLGKARTIPNVWNIVIGHIPPISNPHKVKDGKVKPRVEPDLYRLLEQNRKDIDLYMCADEHNQQLLNYGEDFVPVVISGSGGAILDKTIHIVPTIPTKLARADFGFVGVDVDYNAIQLYYYGVKSEPFQYNIERKRT